MRLNKALGLSFAVVAVGLAVYAVEAFRVRGEAGGFTKSISPAYWVDRATGRDLFDPDKRIWYKGVRNRNEVCITFDDGPHPLSCRSILATLKEKKVTATSDVTRALCARKLGSNAINVSATSPPITPKDSRAIR